MKKFISISAWLFVLITSLCLILTMLSTYKIFNLGYFNNYYIFQSSIVITMFLWSIKQLHLSNKEWINSFLCMLMGFGTMFFMFMKVY
ncbi:hypothetical protein [Clostridium ganghwense]|uniref:Uncharacterized protein n=1 Tax=Clostridium ganghwense TaxID=312089 RepID=A0ABT4CL01_9CLOT|nr:hypothetical protein [Clostridium ganghwense]MCY6369720.1 hypothetical protein [Clostridium ganghwense]